MVTFQVWVRLEADGFFRASCPQLLGFAAQGSTEDECDRDIIQVFLERIVSGDALPDLRDGLSLAVEYVDLRPEETAQRRWEVRLPPHPH